MAIAIASICKPRPPGILDGMDDEPEEQPDPPLKVFADGMKAVILAYAEDVGVCPDCLAKLRDPST